MTLIGYKVEARTDTGHVEYSIHNTKPEADKHAKFVRRNWPREGTVRIIPQYACDKPCGCACHYETRGSLVS